MPGHQLPKEPVHPDVNGIHWQEYEVLFRLAKGNVTKQIARDLGLSPRTIDIYRDRILKRLGATNAAHAVALGFLKGILKPRSFKD